MQSWKARLSRITSEFTGPGYALPRFAELDAPTAPVQRLVIGLFGSGPALPFDEGTNESAKNSADWTSKYSN